MNHFTSTTTSNTRHSNMSRFTSNTTEQEEKQRQENENNKQNDYDIIRSLNNLRDRKQGQYDKPQTHKEYHQLTLLNMTINFTITQSEDNAIITITHPQTSDFTLEYSIAAARLEYLKWLKRGAKIAE
jgi:hypothetical protein